MQYKKNPDSLNSLPKKKNNLMRYLILRIPCLITQKTEKKTKNPQESAKIILYSGSGNRIKITVRTDPLRENKLSCTGIALFLAVPLEQSPTNRNSPLQNLHSFTNFVKAIFTFFEFKSGLRIRINMDPHKFDLMEPNPDPGVKIALKF
jgi:hypothetical protein